MVPGLDTAIKMLPARSAIVDGELFGNVLDLDRLRPATVYEVYAALQGAPSHAVNLKFAAFDLLYLNGQDLTDKPLGERRQMLSMLIGPLVSMPLPVALSVSEGHLANNKDDVNRLYHHFRAQGYEGVITKDLSGRYCLAARDPTWMKRKPEITLDLVLLGATYAVTTKEHSGLFGSYVIGARNNQGGFEDVGDVAGVDRVRDFEIQQEIVREGLVTGRRIERPSSSGVRPGLELRPWIVATIKFEGVVRDQTTGKLSLRDPKVAMIRSDKSAVEADSVDALQEQYLRQRVG
jgi:DNA ligase-1